MTLGETLERSAKRYPEKTAVVFEGRQVTYKTLNADANRLGRALHALGIEKEDKVGLLMPNCSEFIMGTFAALKAGAAFVPLNTSMQHRELTHVITHSDTKIILAAPPYDKLLTILRPQLPQIQHILTVDKNPEEEELISIPFLIESYDDDNLQPAAASDDLAVISYTSGTTGLSKGVMLSHNNILINAVSIGKAINIKHRDVHLTCLPLSHAFAMTAGVILPVFGGMTNVLLEDFLPQAVLQEINDWNVTFFIGVPAMYAALANMQRLEGYEVSQLRVALSNGAPLTQAAVDMFESKFSCKISEGYGLSECSPVVSINPLNHRKIGSIGKPLDDRMTWKIVDDHGNDVPRNAIGELIVRGPNVMQGYYKNGEATQRTIRDGWLYTGDMVSMDDDGFVCIAARKQDMILVDGERVFPKEIEEVLIQHPVVQDAGVIGIEEPARDEASKAYIVPVHGVSVDKENILEFCRERLDPYKVPHAIEIIDFIPRSNTAEILRRVLRRIAAGEPENEGAFDQDFEEETVPEHPQKAPEVSQTSAPLSDTTSFTVEFDEFLKRLVTEISGGIAGSIAGLDGVGVASFSTDPDFPTIIADAELAAVMNSGRGVAETLSAGHPKEIGVVAERYGFLIRRVGQYIVTLATGTDNVNWEAAHSHFNELVPLIAQELF